MKSKKPVLRELASPKEYLETMDVSKAAWGFADRSVSPATDLIAATHAGGLTAGAFENGVMLGFVHGIPRTNRDEPCQHSHLLAVRPEAQGRGLSTLLKLFQRSWCLDHGIRLVTWTFDPFLLKNARLNIGRLRGTVRRILPNFYGAIGGIYGDLPTDRFEIAWRLDDPLVERAARGENPPHSAEHGALPVATPRRLPPAPRLLLPFPAGAPGIYRSDPAGSLRARKSFAKMANELFARGYHVTGIVERPEGPAYLLENA